MRSGHQARDLPAEVPHRKFVGNLAAGQFPVPGGADICPVIRGAGCPDRLALLLHGTEEWTEMFGYHDLPPLRSSRALVRASLTDQTCGSH